MFLAILRKLTFCVGFTVFLSSLAIAPVSAEEQSSRGEFPGRRVGGGTRSGRTPNECLANSNALVALSPVDNLGITASNTPSLYFVLPDLTTNYDVNFVLEDASSVERPNPVVYETRLETQNTVRFLAIHLPENTLIEDKAYRWYFTLACEPYDVVLSGWLRQVAADNLTVDLTLDTLNARLTQVDAYLASGLWSDAIAAIVELHQDYPNDPEAHAKWIALLDQLELRSFIKPTTATER
ncbi:MAG: DUF928 domain-containing protein [Cyanobacteria bacterium P01_G01_bin.54]